MNIYFYEYVLNFAYCFSLNIFSLDVHYYYFPLKSSNVNAYILF